MKKPFILFLALMLSLSSGVYAQDEGGGGSLEGGNLFIEVTGDPFSGTSLMNFGNFRAKLALSESAVVRLGFMFDVNNRQPRPDYTTNFMMYEFTPGFEYHINNEGSFSTFIVADAIVGLQSASYESSDGFSVDGSTQYPSGPDYNFSEGSRGYLKLGGYIGFGANYFVGEKFYIGSEIGFEFTSTMFSDVEVDGLLFQEGTTTNTGFINGTNIFKVGFKLL